LCERILYALVITLVFEGLLRKILPPLSTPIFFLKDILCLTGLLIINRTTLFDITAKLHLRWIKLAFLFLPVLIFTAFKDPILLVFASKQYLLFVVTAILVTVSFPGYKEERFRKFMFLIIILLIPTTFVAVLQISLPATHWLNLSVGGDSLEGFAAAGFLRVGSTFSFTGQYSWFLNAESGFLWASFFMPPTFNSKLYQSLKPLIYFFLLSMLVVSAFITGGRTAVVGCSSVIALGFVFIGVKRPTWFFPNGLLIILLGIGILSVIRAEKPQLFAAYDERSSGYDGTSNNEEIATRVLDGFTGWTKWFWKQDPPAVIFGNGLGVMSNGSQQISSYAADIRANGFWTEGDVPTTFWEGGLYLGVIWYGFRLSLVFLCYQLWRALKNNVFASAASMPFAYIIIHGLTAQLAIQPPLSIWFWLAVGIILFLYRLEKEQATINSSIR
jgi:hypothetical protein